jgi:hypothetical protein
MGSWKRPLFGVLDFLLVSVGLALAVNYASNARLPSDLRPLQDHPWPALGCVLAVIALRAWQRWNGRASVWERPADPPDSWAHLLPSLSARVRRDWIDGVLRPSLRLLPKPVAVRLAQRPDEVAAPQALLLAPHGRALPHDADILTTYDYAQGRLLILGTRGVGKTTTLLTLAEALLERHAASADRAPVVLHSSTWNDDEYAGLDIWVARQLVRQYGLPARAAWSFVTHGLVIPLIDGVDEIPQSLRGGFIAAVNAYQDRAGLYPLTVCCRSEEYTGLPARLVLDTAVEVLPLTLADLDLWVGAQGSDNGVLRALLDDDPELRELAATPLMLGALAAAAADPLALGTLDREGKRRAILDAYITRALTETPRSRLRDTVPAERTRADLVRLAAFMRSREVTVLDPDVIPAEWLPKRSQARWGAYGFGLVSVLVLTVLAGWNAPWNPTHGGSLPAAAVFLLACGIALSGAFRSGYRRRRAVAWFDFIKALAYQAAIGYVVLRAHERQPDAPHLILAVLPLAYAQPVLGLANRALVSRLPETVGLPYGAGRRSTSVAFVLACNVGSLLNTLAELTSFAAYALAFGPSMSLWSELRLFNATEFDPSPGPLTFVRSVWPVALLLMAFLSLWNGRLTTLLRGKLFHALLLRRGALPPDLDGLLARARAHLLMYQSGAGYLFSHQLILQELADEAPPPAPAPGAWRLDPVLTRPFVYSGVFASVLLLTRLTGWGLVVILLGLTVFLVAPFTRFGMCIHLRIPRRTPIWRQDPASKHWGLTDGTTVAAMERKYGRVYGWQLLAAAAVTVVGLDFVNVHPVGWLRYLTILAIVSAVLSSTGVPDVRFSPPGKLRPKLGKVLEKERAAVGALLDDPQSRRQAEAEYGEAVHALSEFIHRLRALGPDRQPVYELVWDAALYGIAVSALPARRPVPIDNVLLPGSPLDRVSSEDEADVVRYAVYIGYCLGIASPLGRRVFVLRLNRQSRILTSMAAESRAAQVG